MNESRRERVSRSFLLVALGLGTFAGVNVSDTTRYVLLTMGAAAMVISVWLLLTNREEPQQAPGPKRLRLGLLVTASVVSWGALGLAVGTRTWAAAVVGAIAAVCVTGAIWWSIRQ